MLDDLVVEAHRAEVGWRGGKQAASFGAQVSDESRGVVAHLDRRRVALEHGRAEGVHCGAGSGVGPVLGCGGVAAELFADLVGLGVAGVEVGQFLDARVDVAQLADDRGEVALLGGGQGVAAGRVGGGDDRLAAGLRLCAVVAQSGGEFRHWDSWR